MNNLICEFITYLQNDTKDFVKVCFLIFTGILAYKTYSNAKKTLFNPIRSEMVKYQMKILTDFIDSHTSKGNNFESSINYRLLLKLNYDVDYLLHIYSTEHIFENHVLTSDDDDRLKFCNDNLAGHYEVVLKNGKVVFDQTMTGDFDSIRQYVFISIVKTKEAANKDLPLQRFFFTKQFYNFYTDLLNLQSNPFVPEEIKKYVALVLENITKNFLILYEILAEYIVNQQPGKYQDALNKFYSKKVSHESDLQNLRKQISKYFKVNET